MNNCWHTGESEAYIDSCEYSKKNCYITKVGISDEVFRVIKKLCKDIKKEWQMYLIGEMLLDNEEELRIINVTDYYISKQEVTGSTVKNIDCITPRFVEDNKIVATIHSHSDMGVFFSTTDTEECNKSIIPTHIVINNKLEYKACTQETLPCGYKTMVDVLVYFGDEDEGVEIKGFENIKVEEYGFNNFNINNGRECQKFIGSYNTSWDNSKKWENNKWAKKKKGKKGLILPWNVKKALEEAEREEELEAIREARTIERDMDLNKDVPKHIPSVVGPHNSFNSPQDWPDY